MNAKENIKYDLSVIIPVYNEEESILELYNEIYNVLESKLSYEIIFINDGSTDCSKKIVHGIIKENKYVRLIDFFSNKGKAEALNAGFLQSSGKIIVTLDADLQDDPNEIPNLINKIRQGYDLVSGWKQKRKDPISKIIPSKFFNFIVRLFSGIRIHDFNCGLKAYKYKVVKSISLYGGMHRFIPVLAKNKGFSVSEIIVNHRERKYGLTKYGSSRLFHGLYDFTTLLFIEKYFTKPLHLFGQLGLFFSTSGLLINFYLFFQWFVFHYSKYKINFFSSEVNEFTIIRPLLFLGILLLLVGIQFISVGLIGELIVKVSRNNINYKNSANFYNTD